MATTNPLAVGLCESPRASQHATPSESNPAPPTRATVKAAGVSSGEPSSSCTVVDEKHSSAKPAPNSITAVIEYRIFMDQLAKKAEHPFRRVLAYVVSFHSPECDFRGLWICAFTSPTFSDAPLCIG